MERGNYFHFFRLGPSRYIDHLLCRQRKASYALFCRSFGLPRDATLLDVGVSANTHPSSNMLERLYPNTAAITGVSIDAFPELEQDFPGFRFIQADGRRLPFADNTFDYVHSHAVIEHVGTNQQQVEFVRELLRVARKGVFVTTPNRWHPVETHTGLPLVQWLPHRVHLALFRLLGKKMYGSIELLNLLGKSDLRRLCHTAAGEGWQIEIEGLPWLGVDANLAAILSR